MYHFTLDELRAHYVAGRGGEPAAPMRVAMWADALRLCWEAVARLNPVPTVRDWDYAATVYHAGREYIHGPVKHIDSPYVVAELLGPDAMKRRPTPVWIVPAIDPQQRFLRGTSLCDIVTIANAAGVPVMAYKTRTEAIYAAAFRFKRSKTSRLCERAERTRTENLEGVKKALTLYVRYPRINPGGLRLIAGLSR